MSTGGEVLFKLLWSHTKLYKILFILSESQNNIISTGEQYK